ncbi:MAG: hypothetical protein U0797_05985 [Gemmataceae bacterium]
MCRFYIPRDLAIYLTIFLVNGSVSRASGSPVEEEVRRGIADKWPAILVDAVRLQGNYHIKEVDKANSGQVLMEADGEWKCSPVAHLARVQFIVTPKQMKGASVWAMDSVQGLNSKYEFSLKRTPNTIPWTVRDILLRAESADLREPHARRIDRSFGFAHLRVCSKPLFELLKDPTFRIKTASGRPAPTGLVVLQFTYGFGGSKNRSAEGQVTLDPSAGWCVVNYDVKQVMKEAAIRQNGTFNYVASESGFPLLTKWVEDYSYTLGSELIRSSEIICTYTCKLTDGTAESECTLSAFGLPEPANVTFSTWRRNLWLIAGGAVVCAALAVFFWWLAQRARAARQVSV